MQRQQFLPHKLLGPPSQQFSSPQWNQHSQRPRYCSGVLWPLLCRWESPRSIVEPALGAGKGPSSPRLLVRFFGSHYSPTPPTQPPAPGISSTHQAGTPGVCREPLSCCTTPGPSWGTESAWVFVCLFVVLQMKSKALQILCHQATSLAPLFFNLIYSCLLSYLL
jgi:hypothetical protein